MDIELIAKIAAPTIAGFGAVLGLFQLLTTRRSQNFQNYKTELELLGQCIDAHCTDPNYKSFLTDIRKEKMSFVAFGIPIPNADLDRVIMYYAQGKATTSEIAKAWRYRNPTKKQLCFDLHGSFKSQYIMVCIYVIVCVSAGAVAFAAMPFTTKFEEFVTLGILSVAFVLIAGFAARANDGLFTAARLAKLKVESSNGGKKA